ncbi:MAG: hypothetical protein QOE14_1321 [Humisphaera sp.]|nr:hypothetical protein [Humisphaera sp.]
MLTCAARVTCAFLVVLVLTSDARGAVGAAATTRSAADRSTPQAAMQTLVEAIEREDEAAIAAGVHSTNEAQHKIALAYARGFIATRRYCQAMFKRWGRQESIESYVQHDLRQPYAYLDYARAEWDIEVDRAVLKHRPGTRGLAALSPLQKIDGQWLYDPTRRMSPKELVFVVANAEQNIAKYTKLAADIEAGKFASVHDAIDVLFPRQRPQHAERPKLPKEQTDPRTIQGAVWSLGLALEEEDVLAAAKFYHADGPAGAQLAEAHVKHILAAHRFIIAASEIGGSQLAGQFDLIDGRDDLFGHLITEWTIKGDRATGTNEAGPADAQMRRVDGFWKIDLTPPAGSPSADKLAGQLRRDTKIMAAVTADIREKRLFTADEVRRELKRRGLAPATQPAGEGEGEVDMN